MKNVAYLLTGGNIGNRPASLALAARSIGENCGRIIKTSDVYETEAWGNPDQNAFLNQAVCIKTELSPDELLAAILAIEQEMGRVRKEKNGPRVIDIDILFYNDVVVNKPGLTIPHPHLHERKFALTCLSDIAPGLVHPVFNKTVTELLHACPDKLNVNKF